MKDAFGGAFMIKIILVFIVIFVTFMAAAVTYAKAFRVKNNVINILEQNQSSDKNLDDVINQVDVYLASVPYNENNETTIRDCSKAGGKFTDYGVCIVPQGDSNFRYYKVITYISVSLPFFHIDLTMPISGETKTISY
ncbi:MAG: hypothetical protein ACI4U0_00090 [Candidatus Aphodocola sp.]